MAKVLVTPRSITRDGHPSLDRLKSAGFEVAFCTPGQQPSADELLQLLPGCVGYLAGVEKVSANVLESANDLKVISRNGVGVDSIDLKAAERLGIKVCRTPGANARGVAELAIGLLLSLVRSIPFSDATLKAEEWDRRKGIEIKDRLLGVYGCGQIGREVVCMALGLGMRVIAYDPFPHQSFDPGGGFRFVESSEVLEASDIVTLHCPVPDSGEPVIDEEAIKNMKRGAYLINTARADLVDEAPLLAALEEGHIAGAAIDVYASEPPGDNPLVKHTNVIATPHVGGTTTESVDRAMDRAVDNLLAVLKK